MRAVSYLILMLTVVPHATVLAAPVIFPDPGLEAAVRDALGQPTGPIDDADVATLTLLLADHRDIADLTGLEAATGLESLIVGGNNISDLAPISMLPNLESLSAINNNISDLSPLATLTTLQNLYISSNPVDDISPLEGLPNLFQLLIDDTDVTDFSSLTTLPALYELWIGGPNLTSLPSVLSSLSLSTLLVRNAPITDLSPLAPLTNLSSLTLRGITSSDLSPLSGMTSMGHLYIEGSVSNPITDLSPLSGMTNLISLGLNTFAATSLDAVPNSPFLLSLDLSNNSNLTDIDVVTGFTSLVQIQLTFLGVSDLQPIVDNVAFAAGDNLSLIDLPLNQDTICDDLPLLQARLDFVQLDGIDDCFAGATEVTIPDAALLAAVRLAVDRPQGLIYDVHMEQIASLFGEGVTDLTGLEFAVNLHTLHLSDGNISDLTPIAGLPDLRVIDVPDNNVSSLTPLAGLAGTLEVLNVSGNPLTNVNGLQNLAALTTFQGFDSQIMDLSALSGQSMPNLVGFAIDRTPIIDVSPLASLTGIDSLGLGDTLIRDISALVANVNIGAGDFLNVHNAPLNQESMCEGVPALRARGVNLFENGDCLSTDIGCPVRPKADLGGEAAYASVGLNWNTDDIDGDGLPDRWQVLLAATILCHENLPFHDATFAAYEHNYLQLMAETDTTVPMPSLVSVRHYLSTILLTSTTLRDAVIAAAGLDNEYQVVKLPFKAPDEPYSGSGDFDGDGVTNAQEAANVLGQGENLEFFLHVVQNASLSGVETLPAASAFALAVLAGVLAFVAVRRARPMRSSAGRVD